MSLAGKNIILGVTGSIAAYKAIYLLRLLQKQEANIKVVTTPAVSHFINDLSFSSLTHEPVFSGLWEAKWSEHVNMGTWANLMVIAPATANTLAKFAHGICDNALTAVYLAATCPVMVAPAMDADMYDHPAVLRNIKQLEDDGVWILPPDKGYLASGLAGKGRLMEPDDILSHIQTFFRKDKPLKNQKVLITAGPTQEAIDPVRYITNHSSGKMGYALATEAIILGAEVTLVSGPTALKAPVGVNMVRVISTQDMYEAVDSVFSQHTITIMSAAVSDYTPVEVSGTKIKKLGDSLSLELRKTVDILHTMGTQKRADQFLVGFALETDNELEHAQGKLLHKNLDLIVLNSLQDAGAGFGHETNKITLIPKEGKAETYPLKPKSEVARDIFQMIIKQLTI